MTYRLPEAEFDYTTRATNTTLKARNFKEDAVFRYRQAYESFWYIEDPEVGQAEMQGILDRMPDALMILQESAAYIMGINAAFPGLLPEKYHSSPYHYSVTDAVFLDGHTEELIPSAELFMLTLQHGPLVGGRLVLGELKEAWQPEEEPEPEE